MKNHLFEGVCTAVVTPFKDDLTVDYNALGRLIDLQLKHNVDALVLCGTTGESSTLSDLEKLSIINFAVEMVNGKVPVIAGTGSNNTAHSANLSKKAEVLGASAVLVVTPYYNKTSQNGLVEHYRTIAKNIEIPIVVYNVPARTGMTIEPETYKKLSEIKNIDYVKEASTDLSKIKKSIELCGERFVFYSGNDDMTIDLMKLGAKGVISVTSNIIPQAFEKLTKQCLNNRFDQAENSMSEIIELIKMMFIDVNPIPIKYALSVLGLCHPTLRLPLVELCLKDMIAINRTLSKMNFTL